MSDAAIAIAIQELVIANRIMAHENVIDDFGHVSVRHPLRADRYFISRSRSPEPVTREDIMELTLDDEPVEQNGRPMYKERVIHSAIYKARPDINAAVHHHAKELLPFTISEGAHAKYRPESIGTETQVRYLAQKLQAMFFRLKRVFLRITVA